MHCPKAGSVVFIGLVLMTAGFVLTLAGWFAPPIREAVLRVRLAGPVSLLVGLFLLAVSCCVCAVQQRKCCMCCHPEDTEETTGRYDHTQMSPLLLREMRIAIDTMGVTSTAASSATGSAQCSCSSLPQHPDNYPRDSLGSIGSAIRNHHSPRKKRRGHASTNTHRSNHNSRNPLQGGTATCVSSTYKHSSSYNSAGALAPRPASVFLPQTALDNETYFCPHGAGSSQSPTGTADLYRKQVQVALQPLSTCAVDANSPYSPSPTGQRQTEPLTPTVYLRTYGEDIVSAL